MIERALAEPVSVEQLLLDRASSPSSRRAAKRSTSTRRSRATRSRHRDSRRAISPSAGLEELAPYVEYGASPRGPINLVLGARALALLRGRRYVLPQDVRELAKDVLRHRMVLSYEALAEGVDADRILDRVLETIAMPQLDLVRGGRRMSTRARPQACSHARAARPRRRCPTALLRKVDLTVRRRIDGLLAGDHRSWALRRRDRARPGPPVRRSATTSG